MKLVCRLWAVTAAALVAATSAFAQPAIAADSPPQPPINPAIAVYVEQIPTSEGSVVAGSTSGGPAKPPRAIVGKLRREGGADAAALEDLVTSAGLGAPSPVVRAAGKKPDVRAAGKKLTVQQKRLRGTDSSAVAATAISGGGGRPVGLIVVLALVTAGTMVARRIQRNIGRRRVAAPAADVVRDVRARS